MKQHIAIFPYSGMRRTLALLIAIAMCVVTAKVAAAPTEIAAAAQDAAAPTAEDAGQRIYRDGILPSGESIGGTLQSDVPLVGDQLSCSSCHGRSGLGATEGTIVTPAITGTILYKRMEIRRKELYSSRLIRPAFTDESLARAIRSGIDANGEDLDPMMPRYAFSDKDTGLLINYIKSMSPELSPGVTDEEIHFATIVTDKVDSDKRQAVLDVMTTFFNSKNATTRQETRRAVNAPFHKEWKYEAYRKWALHVWELSGSVDEWSAQLERYYQEQPVFALLSGIGSGSWQPVHEFCETHSVPCILPMTDLPNTSESDYYTLYFSKGISLAAGALAKHLNESNVNAGRIIQVHRADDRSLVAAQALRRGLKEDYFPDVRDRIVDQDEQITGAFWKSLVDDDEAYSLVLWLDEDDLAALDAIANLDSGPRRIYLAATMIDRRLDEIPAEIRDRTYLIYPYDLPQDATGRLKRTNIWMRNQELDITHEKLQANVLFTVMLVSQALKHIGSNFYRDYFLEKIEHTLDSMATLASYPNLSLARNQRFASKGCYIATVAEGADGEFVLEGEWIVP